MADTVNVNFKLDRDVKKSMEIACEDMGLSMTAAFTIFAKKVARERRIPFEISAGEPNDVTYAAMESAEKGEDVYGPFDSVADLMDALNA